MKKMHQKFHRTNLSQPLSLQHHAQLDQELQEDYRECSC